MHSKRNFSVLVFTLNEEVHLPSCLASLAPYSSDIVVIDSFSTDGTEAIARTSGVRFVQHAFEGFGSQRNWALLNTDLKHEWVLILDADERLTPELAAELQQIADEDLPDVAAYQIRRRFHMWGRWLRYSNLYPTWVVRFVHRQRVVYENRGHAETQSLRGQLLSLKNDLIDENLKGIDEWFERQNRYSRKEAEYELAEERRSFSLSALWSSDPLQRRAAMKRLARNVPFRPLLYFLYAYVWRLGFLEGRDGFTFCMMRATYQAMIVAKKHEARRRT